MSAASDDRSPSAAVTAGSVRLQEAASVNSTPDEVGGPSLGAPRKRFAKPLRMVPHTPLPPGTRKKSAVPPMPTYIPTRARAAKSQKKSIFLIKKMPPKRQASCGPPG
jgi:hypothetical protein